MVSFYHDSPPGYFANPTISAISAPALTASTFPCDHTSQPCPVIYQEGETAGFQQGFAAGKRLGANAGVQICFLCGQDLKRHGKKKEVKGLAKLKTKGAKIFKRFWKKVRGLCGHRKGKGKRVEKNVDEAISFEIPEITN